MAVYVCMVILLVISLYSSGKLQSVSAANEIPDDSQRSGWSVVEKQPCPTWYQKTKYRYNGVTRCVCGANLGGRVVCNDATQETLIIKGICMSYDYTINETVVGQCPFNYHHPDAKDFYVTLPNDTSELNTFMCGGLNRTGLLCSQCQQGLGPSITSYNRQCIECFDKRYGWLLYITATLIVTTILCFLVMVFQLHVTSAEMNAFVFLCQFITCVSTLTNPYVYVHHITDLSGINFIIFALLTFYGIWNLDFFRYFLPSFCISNDMTTLHTLALEYVVAIYPLLLIVIVYVCIEMYDSGVRVVVCVWRPFRVCFARFKRRWNPKGSVIKTYATFLLLSYSKLLTVSYSLLDGVELYNNTGRTISPVVLYYDASIEYFSKKHLPFALPALCVLLVFVVFPLLLLLLYPMRSFQRCLGYCTRIRWHFLHTFADAFQGCYKNGTNGTRDYRYFAGLYLLFRVVLLVAFISTTADYFWLIIILFAVIISLLFAFFRPYKNNYFNIIDSSCFALLAISSFLLMYAIHISYIPFELLYVVLLIPFLYFIALISIKLISCMRPLRTCCRRIGKILQARNNNETQQPPILRCHNTNNDLPDRIVNPNMYLPLIPATNYTST